MVLIARWSNFMQEPDFLIISLSLSPPAKIPTYLGKN